ncbi:MAG TPA: type II toxin-antitoxin system VapC family toxin [Candidatus Acidoferrales bacterium]|nr:type II toxin-antitoxin system VapC family toxin [Candidatus Acidoferrales bacterium]
MATAILDTSVYIDHWERGLHQNTLENIRRAYIIRHSAVVLSELRRGARGRDAERLVAELFELATVRWEPSVVDWWEAGRLVRNIGDNHGWDIHKRRDFQNDALIALTARRYGATVVTADYSDFELLRAELRISVLSAQWKRQAAACWQSNQFWSDHGFVPTAQWNGCVIKKVPSESA